LVWRRGATSRRVAGRGRVERRWWRRGWHSRGGDGDTGERGEVEDNADKGCDEV